MSIQPIQSMQPSMPNPAPEENKPTNLFNLKKRPLEQIEMPNKKRKISTDNINKKDLCLANVLGIGLGQMPDHPADVHQPQTDSDRGLLSPNCPAFDQDLGIEFKILENANIKIILNFLRNTESSKTGKEFNICNIKKVQKFDAKDCKLTVVNYTDIPVNFDDNRKLFIENQYITTFTADDCQIVVYKESNPSSDLYIANKDEANPNINLNNISGYMKLGNRWMKHISENFDIAEAVRSRIEAMNKLFDNPYMS